MGRDRGNTIGVVMRVIWKFSTNCHKNAKLDEAQFGRKVAGRDINNFRYADDTTLTAESEEELKALLMKVKDKSGNVGLSKAQHSEN